MTAVIGKVEPLIVIGAAAKPQARAPVTNLAAEVIPKAVNPASQPIRVSIDKGKLLLQEKAPDE